MSLSRDREPVEVLMAGGKTAVIWEYYSRNGYIVFPWPYYRLPEVIGTRIAMDGRWRKVKP